MRLHPQTAAHLERTTGPFRPYQQTVAEARAGMLSRERLRGPEMPTEDRSISGRDDGLAYAECLKQVGVETRSHCYPGQIHGFLAAAPQFDDSKAALAEIASWLNG